jgi:hypothetical protein
VKRTKHTTQPKPKRDWTKAIGQSIKRDIQRSKDSGMFWQDSVEFDYDIELDERYDDKTEQIFELIKEPGKRYTKAYQKMRDLRIVLGNLFDQTRKPIAVSLNNNDYVKNAYMNSSLFTTKIIERLRQQNFIEMKPGFNDKKNPSASRMSRIKATEKLLEYCHRSSGMVVYNPKELVILKDSDKNLIPYKDTNNIRQIRAVLRRVNAVNNAAEILYDNEKIKTLIRAIFIERFGWYGRLHTKGFRHPQGIESDEREWITINGDPIVELDYSAMLPNLLYAAEEIQFPVDRDPYRAVDLRPELRPFLKHILISMANSKNMVAAESSGNNWFHENTEEWLTLKRLKIVTKARPFIEKFMEVHAPIAHHFCRGKETGMVTMNKDSKIALRVVSHFVKQGIPIIPVHDSFIVQS